MEGLILMSKVRFFLKVTITYVVLCLLLRKSLGQLFKERDRSIIYRKLIHVMDITVVVSTQKKILNLYYTEK